VRNSLHLLQAAGEDGATTRILPWVGTTCPGSDLWRRGRRQTPLPASPAPGCTPAPGPDPAAGPRSQSLAPSASPETNSSRNSLSSRAAGAQRSLWLRFPSRLAPTHPGSHCAGPQGSDCLAAPADRWHRPRAPSPGHGVPSTSLGLSDLQEKKFPPRAAPVRRVSPARRRAFQELPRASRALGGGCSRSPAQWAVPAPAPPSPPSCPASAGTEPQEGTRRGTSWGLLPAAYPGFPPRGMAGKASQEMSVVCMSLPGMVALQPSPPGTAVGFARSGSGIFPACGRGTCGSWGFIPFWGPPFSRWGWGHAKPPKLICDGAGLGHPLQMPEGEGETG